jgi:uncharacterized membrane protein YfcA
MSLTPATQLLLAALLVVAIAFCVRWYVIERRAGGARGVSRRPRWFDLTCGFVANFFDTLGIGSFATTTSAYKLRRWVADENIPGTLNVGHALPTVVQALIFVVTVTVGSVTLIAMILASVLGAWLGAGVVARLPRRAIQVGMGAALLLAAGLFTGVNLQWLPGGGTATSLTGPDLYIGVGVNFVLGALMTLGIGLYAPCLILVSLLGLNPQAAFPIMMGSCAFLMPPAGARFIELRRYDLRAALGLAVGGIPAVLIAAFVVRSLPLVWLRWLVVVVVVYAALAMLRSAFVERARSVDRAIA